MLAASEEQEQASERETCDDWPSEVCRKIGRRVEDLLKTQERLWLIGINGQNGPMARNVLQKLIQGQAKVPLRRDWNQEMLSHCANQQCSKPFLKLREGKLFLVETERLLKPGEAAAPPFVRARQQQRLVEHYWLCDQCAQHWTLVYDREKGVALSPIRKAPLSAAAAVGSLQNGVA